MLRPRRSSTTKVRTGRLCGKMARNRSSDVPASNCASAGRTCPSIQTWNGIWRTRCDHGLAADVKAG